jgi:RNA polymerase sigma-70 factor (ECF subfamily)
MPVRHHDAMGAYQRRAVADEALVRHLFQEHGRAVLAYATRLTGDVAAAEDVCQETLVWAWRHSASLVEGKCSARVRLLSVAGALAAGERPRAPGPTGPVRRKAGPRFRWRTGRRAQSCQQLSGRRAG